MGQPDPLRPSGRSIPVITCRNLPHRARLPCVCRTLELTIGVRHALDAASFERQATRQAAKGPTWRGGILPPLLRFGVDDIAAGTRRVCLEAEMALVFCHCGVCGCCLLHSTASCTIGKSSQWHDYNYPCRATIIYRRYLSCGSYPGVGAAGMSARTDSAIARTRTDMAWVRPWWSRTFALRSELIRPSVSLVAGQSRRRLPSGFPRGWATRSYRFGQALGQRKGAPMSLE